MRTLNKTIIAIAATLIMSGNASALSVVGADTTSVRVEITDGVATLHGSVEELIEKNLVANEVSSQDGVEEVKNFLIVRS